MQCAGARSRDAQGITDACAAFGFSRPSFYQAQTAFEREGLSGLLPKRRGPRAAHKLTDEVSAFVAQQIGEDQTLAWPALVQRIAQHFDLTVHPRSIERALMREKKNLSEPRATAARTRRRQWWKKRRDSW